MNKLLNWSELSRYITKGDRNGIRFGKIPKKHIRRGGYWLQRCMNEFCQFLDKGNKFRKEHFSKKYNQESVNAFLKTL